MRKSFSLDIHQLMWDSTSLQLFLECPRKYYYTIIEGWTTSEQNVHLWFGGAVHSGVEVFEHSKAAGAPHEESMDAMVEHLLTLSAGAPHDPHGYKTPHNLIRTMTWYYTQFADDPYQTLILANGQPATELSFQFDLGSESHITGERYTYAGHLDRVASIDNFETLMVQDHKTTKNTLGQYFFSGFDLSVQFTGYTIGGQVTLGPRVKGVEVNGMSVQKTQSQFARYTSYRDRGVLDEFLVEVPYHIARAAQYAERSLQHGTPEGRASAWPHNWSACGHYAGCAFAKICSKHPLVREQWLAGSFQKRRELWDPAVSRERAIKPA